MSNDLPKAIYVPKYFGDIDFHTANPKCELADMDMRFLEKIDRFRDYVGVPFKVNCAFRSKEHEKKMGRSGNSMHCKGRAMDISTCHFDGAALWKIVMTAPVFGLNGIGIYDGFIHLDDRSVPCLWYGKK